MADFGANLHRIMAKRGLTVQAVAECTGVDPRTVRSILTGEKPRPHARTLYRLASGLGIQSDEFFQDPSLPAERTLERIPHPIICEVMSTHPDLFEGWSLADFESLYSSVDASECTTRERVLRQVRTANEKREFYRKVNLVLDSDQAATFVAIIDVLYANLPTKGSPPVPR